MKKKINLFGGKFGQAVSADVLVVVVIVLFGSLFLVMNKINEEESQNLELRAKAATVESKIIVEELKTQGIIDSENKVEVGELLVLDDVELKEKLGLKNDFAIVFEKDGKLVKIDPENDVTCIGSSAISVNGETCS